MFNVKKNSYLKQIGRAVICLLLAMTAHSPAFAATVQLLWDAPTTNEDGTSLTDLSHYKLYLGTKSNEYSKITDNISSSSHTLNLQAGKYFAAVTALDYSGNESSYSNELAFTVGGSGSDMYDENTDSDGDGISDKDDNCPTVWNPGQEDSNGNGIGDACEGLPDANSAIKLDFDGDGFSDLGVFARSSAEGLRHLVHYSSDSGIHELSGGETKDMAAYGDYDGDGITETSVVGRVRSNLEWRSWQHDAAFEPVRFGKTRDTYLASCDFDGDGTADPAVLTNRNLLRFLSSATGKAVKARSRLGAANKVRDLYCADLNGDGSDDLLVLLKKERNSTPAKGLVLSGYSTLSAKPLFTKRVAKPRGIIAIDVNGDGRMDAGYIKRVREQHQLTLFISGKDTVVQYELPAMREFTVGTFADTGDNSFSGIAFISPEQELKVVNVSDGSVNTVMEADAVTGTRLIKAFNYRRGRAIR